MIESCSVLIPLLKIRYKVVTSVHGLIGFKFYEKKVLWFFFRNLLLVSDGLIAHGLNEYDILNKLHSHVLWITNGVDTQDFPKNQKKIRKCITFVGRIHQQKGIDVLLDTFQKIQSQIPEFNLQIIGKKDGAYYELLKSMHLKTRVTWKGFILNRKTLFSELSSSYLLVFPSRWEAAPWPALVEGLYSGRPVIASDLKGMRRIFNDRKELILVKPENVSELAEAILSLIKNKKNAEIIGKKGKEKASNFKIENIAEKISAFLVS